MSSYLDNNRSFLYGDGFFETFILTAGKNSSFALHYQRIIQSAVILQFELDKEWTQSFFEEKLLDDSKMFNCQLLKTRIIFYRDSEGTYLPKKDSAQFYIKLEPYTPLSKKVLLSGIYPLAKKPCNFLSNLKSTSCLLFVMAAKYADEKGWDEAIILNEHNRVCEALTSNIFIKKENIYYTPPLSEGCIDGVNRKIFLAENNNVAEKEIEIDELKNYEIYFSNAVRGMIKGKFEF